MGTCTTECATAGCTEGMGGPLDDVHWFDGYEEMPSGGGRCWYEDVYGNRWAMVVVE